MPSSTPSLAERCVLPVLLAGVLALAPLPARAEGEAGAQDVETLARAKFAEGNLAYDLAEFGKALDAYGEAYRLMPLPGFLFNIAQCHRQLGNAERAAFFYRRYLSLSREEPPNAALVRELIEEMDAAVRLEQERRLKREEIARDKARAAALRAQAEAEAAAQRQKPRLRQPPASKERPGFLPEPARARDEVKAQDSLAKKWWVWAGAGAVAVIAGGLIYAATAPQPRPATLGTLQ